MDSPCIPWPGTIDAKGYGRQKVNRVPKLAHRLAYEAAMGPIPAVFVIDHRCHSEDESCPGGSVCPHRRCVNPDHLEIVTVAENNRRGRVNANKTECKNGHPFDESNTYITARGSRECRACNKTRAFARYWAVSAV